MMFAPPRVIRLLSGGALLAMLTTGTAVAQDSLSEARGLYAAAAYEEALQMLDRLRGAAGREEDLAAVEQYRAFCLLALDRTQDAEEAIASIVAIDPTYVPPIGDMSPRIVGTFSDVRKRKLPEVITQAYLEARNAYDRQDYDEAASRFSMVVEVLSEPSVASVASELPLSDVRILAEGFRDLSVAAALPPPPPPAPPPPVESSLVVEPSFESPVAEPVPVGPPPTFGSRDLQVVPPLAVRQFLPPYPARDAPPGTGVLEVVIDETGAVESASMTTPISALYDRLAVEAAREWEFQPATLDGVPVRYRKTIRIEIKR